MGFGATREALTSLEMGREGGRDLRGFVVGMLGR